MEENGLSEIVNCDDLKEGDKKNDSKANLLIVQCIGDSLLEIVKRCKNSKEMMDDLENIRNRTWRKK